MATSARIEELRVLKKDDIARWKVQELYVNNKNTKEKWVNRIQRE